MVEEAEDEGERGRGCFGFVCLAEPEHDSTWYRLSKRYERLPSWVKT
jgi:hypothetical protein